MHRFLTGQQAIADAIDPRGGVNLQGDVLATGSSYWRFTLTCCGSCVASLCGGRYTCNGAPRPSASQGERRSRVFFALAEHPQR